MLDLRQQRWGFHLNHHYHAYGLTIESEIPCPQYQKAPPGSADVVIRFAEVPKSLPSGKWVTPSLQVNHRQYLGIGSDGLRMLLNDGKEVHFDTPRPNESAEIHYLLHTTCMSGILIQRHMIALHGNMLAHDGKAIVLMGHPGAGKSTLTAALYQSGLQVLGDDLIALSVLNGTAWAHPGNCQISLLPDALGLLGIPQEAVSHEPDSSNKYALPTNRVTSANLPAKAIFLLQPEARNDIVISPVVGLEKFALFRHNIFQAASLFHMGVAETHLRHCSELCKAVPLWRISRPESRSCLDDLVARVHDSLSNDAG